MIDTNISLTRNIKRIWLAALLSEKYTPTNNECLYINYGNGDERHSSLGILVELLKLDFFLLGTEAKRSMYIALPDGSMDFEIETFSNIIGYDNYLVLSTFDMNNGDLVSYSNDILEFITKIKTKD